MKTNNLDEWTNILLSNYEYDPLGIIKQIQYVRYSYTKEYAQTRYMNKLAELMSYLRLGYILGSIKHTPQSLLDVGYGTGAFLQCSSNIIKDTYGHDISGYPIPLCSTFECNIFSRHYDVVTFFDSLEHFEDIYFLNKLDCNYICISVPWCHYFSDQWFDTWKHRRANEHLWHFNQQSLIKFMDSQGFDVINTCNYEDTIRKTQDNYPNILSGIFVNRKSLM